MKRTARILRFSLAGVLAAWIGLGASVPVSAIADDAAAGSFRATPAEAVALTRPGAVNPRHEPVEDSGLSIQILNVGEPVHNPDEPLNVTVEVRNTGTTDRHLEYIDLYAQRRYTIREQDLIRWQEGGRFSERWIMRMRTDMTLTPGSAIRQTLTASPADWARVTSPGGPRGIEVQAVAAEESVVDRSVVITPLQQRVAPTGLTTVVPLLPDYSNLGPLWENLTSSAKTTTPGVETAGGSPWQTLYAWANQPLIDAHTLDAATLYEPGAPWMTFLVDMRTEKSLESVLPGAGGWLPTAPGDPDVAVLAERGERRLLEAASRVVSGTQGGTFKPESAREQGTFFVPMGDVSPQALSVISRSPAQAVMLWDHNMPVDTQKSRVPDGETHPHTIMTYQSVTKDVLIANSTLSQVLLGRLGNETLSSLDAQQLLLGLTAAHAAGGKDVEEDGDVRVQATPLLLRVSRTDATSMNAPLIARRLALLGGMPWIKPTTLPALLADPFDPTLRSTVDLPPVDDGALTSREVDRLGASISSVRAMAAAIDAGQKETAAVGPAPAPAPTGTPSPAGTQPSPNAAPTPAPAGAAPAPAAPNAPAAPTPAAPTPNPATPAAPATSGTPATAPAPTPTTTAPATSGEPPLGGPTPSSSSSSPAGTAPAELMPMPVTRIIANRGIQLLSTQLRAASAERREALRDFEKVTSTITRGLIVEPSSTLNVIAQDVQLPVHVKNTLPFPVSVRVVLQPSDDRIRVTGPFALTVAPSSTSTARIPVEASGFSDVLVRIRVQNAAGHDLAPVEKVKVRVRANVENIGTAIVVGAIALIFVVGVVKSSKRKQRSRSAQTQQSTMAVTRLNEEA